MSQQKCCPNGRGDHNALAMKCKKMKDILTLKRKEDKERSQTTYTSAVKRNIQPSTSNTNNIDKIETDKHDRMYMCMMHTHFKNSKNPGTYEQELNKMLTANNLPTLKVPEDPPSLDILTAINRETEHKETEKEIKGNKRAREEESESDQSNENINIMEASVLSEETAVACKPKTTQKVNQSLSMERVKNKTNPQSGLEIELMIAAKKSEGLPKGLSRKNIIKCIEGKKLKYTYEKDCIEEEDLLKLREKNKIDLTDCFTVIDDAIFDKIRSGLIRKRGSPNEFEKRKEE